MAATLPQPPYYAAIFTSRRTPDGEGYAATAARMLDLAAEQPGFLGVDSVRGGDGAGITVSYWASEAAMRAWQVQAEHLVAQAEGRARWYAAYTVRIARVERAYGQG